MANENGNFAAQIYLPLSIQWKTVGLFESADEAINYCRSQKDTDDLRTLRVFDSENGQVIFSTG